MWWTTDNHRSNTSTVFISELTRQLPEYQQIFRKLSRKWFICFDLSKTDPPNTTWTCTDRGKSFKIQEIIQRYTILWYLKYFQSIIYFYYSDFAGYFLVSGWSGDTADVWISSCTSELLNKNSMSVSFLLFCPFGVASHFKKLFHVF